MRSAWLVLGLVGCSTWTEEGPLFSAQAVETEAGLYLMDLTLDPDPAVTGPTVLHVDIEPAVDLFDVEPWMTDHDHGVSPPPAIDGDNTRFSADWDWPMPGYWELTFTVDGPTGPDTLVLGVDVQ